MDNKEALEAFEAIVCLGGYSVEKMLPKQIEIVRAALTRPSVDVEGLKKILHKFYKKSSWGNADLCCYETIDFLVDHLHAMDHLAPRLEQIEGLAEALDAGSFLDRHSSFLEKYGQAVEDVIEQAAQEYLKQTGGE